MPIPDFSMFENRLRKNLKHLQKWAQRESVSCFRVYDADIPEFPLMVDVYEQALYVAEYSRKHPLSEDEYSLWLSGSLLTLSECLGIPKNLIFLKLRHKQSQGLQYQKAADLQREFCVTENGLRFWVNLSDYLDTGLFLDHRDTRALVRDLAAGKDVLNLFAYTGSFSVYAAAGGARSTTTVDMSHTYLKWAERNMRENGFHGPQHRFLQADAVAWLRDDDGVRYDLIVLDPPSFSNSKRMKSDFFDVQRDHPFLIHRCMERLRTGGKLFFSTNLRNFECQIPAAQWPYRDISRLTTPEDFRNRKPHFCFEFSKG
jgi:23S rRNA (cytosine1962-C5)-methyltransferase